jgi:hypothetical protein
MAFFLQRRVQPLQHRISKLWSFSGLGDYSRVSDDLMEKKDLDKQVRALTTLTKEDEIPALTAGYVDFEHHLPAVCALSPFIRLLLPYHFSYNFWLVFLSGSSVPCFSLKEICPRGNNNIVIIIFLVHDNVYIPC